MRRKSAVAALSLFLLFMFALPAIAEAAFWKKKIGSATVVKGRVWVTREKKFKSDRVKLGTPIYQNDRIRTENKAKVRIVFKDQSIISIGSKSALTITEYIFDPAKKVRSSRLRLMWGKVKVYANDFMGYRKKKFAVATNTTIVGVRGTVFLVWIVDDTITRVAAFQNEVEVALRSDLENYIVLSANQMTQIQAGEPLSEPLDVTPAELKILQEGLLVEDQQTTLTTVGTTTEGDTTEGDTTEGDTTVGDTTAGDTTMGDTTSPTTTTTTSTSTTTTTTTTTSTSTTTTTSTTTSTLPTLPNWPSPPTTQPPAQLPGFPSTPGT